MPGRKQVREDHGGRRFDVGYSLRRPGERVGTADCLVLVELDGRLFHEGRQTADRRKANAMVVKGTPLLRFGWPEVAGDPCATAAEVARFAASRGLSWPIHPCRRAGCTLARAEGRIA